MSKEIESCFIEAAAKDKVLVSSVAKNQAQFAHGLSHCGGGFKENFEALLPWKLPTFGFPKANTGFQACVGF